ncbi:type II toxin-antitoxin system RelE/ParE family toxin [Paraburkholderia sp. CNPSo 3155]|uniref:type II toxin-antitoxin system RelE/ParE family toxin n=1 Tax=Paraburkholderia TaxID=1822464 RepID=UPI0013235C8D|nr:type II toxin-antitoxin system RelE/ParE family toxin [Paraburkholderia atlantica]MPW11693.1 type II toxin-antitoxin system RelE/ParE family toxin [Paraburkholderia atlantica]
MSFRVRYAASARDDLKRLYGFLVRRDVAAAERALEAIRRAVEVLRDFPFTCRKVDDANPFLRELVISFGNSGYVALFEIEGEQEGAAVQDEADEQDEPVRYVSILAVRHQREDDWL